MYVYSDMRSSFNIPFIVHQLCCVRYSTVLMAYWDCQMLLVMFVVSYCVEILPPDQSEEIVCQWEWVAEAISAHFQPNTSGGTGRQQEWLVCVHPYVFVWACVSVLRYVSIF